MIRLSAAALIEQLKPDAADATVARLVTLYMLESDRQPYWFSINHDIRPPAMKKCPLEFDWAIKDRVGIKTRMRHRAEKWITDAALAGYTIAREGGGLSLTMSIAHARRVAEIAQRPPLADDEEIPF
jgi:hypothetical protein